MVSNMVILREFTKHTLKEVVRLRSSKLKLQIPCEFRHGILLFRFHPKKYFFSVHPRLKIGSVIRQPCFLCCQNLRGFSEGSKKNNFFNYIVQFSAEGGKCLSPESLACHDKDNNWSVAIPFGLSAKSVKRRRGITIYNLSIGETVV